MSMLEDIPLMSIANLQSCQQYVTQLASSEQALSDANVKVVVIGCGDWQAIKAYSGNFYSTLHIIKYSV